MVAADEVNDELDSSVLQSVPKLREYRIQIPPLQERLIDRGDSRRWRLLDFLKAKPSTDWLKSLKLSTPINIFRHTLHQKEEISISVPSPAGVRRRFHIHWFRKIDWHSLVSSSKEWLKNPMNVALLLWLLCVGVSATMLGLLLLGLLNDAFPTKSLRNYWIEINNQVLNALFTLMSLYQHPILCYHLVMLCRWRAEDVVELRKTYCKNGAYRPNEWSHMMVVLVLLHITCLAQYFLCGLYWGYSRRDRPELLENLFFGLGLAAPVFAALYAVYSPLGREIEWSSDEAEEEKPPCKNKRGLKLTEQRATVSKPEWAGGLLDCRDDATVCCLSLLCTCCVFGWNMERLGFGNMYVHIVTFLLLCVAPFWIFNIAALNIHNYVIGDVAGVAGIVLCACGLMYGGYWRIQMRRRFKLPGDGRFCCGSASVTDYVKWMCCWACALAQEVRTGNLYDVEDDSLFRKLVIVESDGEGQSEVEDDKACEEEAPALTSIQDPPALLVIQVEEIHQRIDTLSKERM